MKIADIAEVIALADDRRHLLSQSVGKIGIRINGWEMPQSFIDVVAPAIRLEIRHQIEDIEAKLREFGIEAR